LKTHKFQHVGLSLLLALALGCGCKRANQASAGPNPKEETKPQSPPVFQTQFQDESQFIVESVVSDLAEMAFFASRQQLPDPQSFSVHANEREDSSFGTPAYDLTVILEKGQEPLRFELKVEDPIWSAHVYNGITTALAKYVGLNTLERSQRGVGTALLGNLTDGLAATVERENIKLSMALQNDFNNPVLHEQAAILLGAFALREHSGDFYDIRFPLCRMTAHLSFANFLLGRNLPDINGRIAEAMLLTLMNDQAAAVKELRDIEPTDGTLTNWVRTLLCRNTSDYRTLTGLVAPSMIERIAWFHGFSKAANPDLAWIKIGKLPDFCRVAEEEGYSVETGNDLLQLSLKLELGEISAVYEISQGRKLTQAELVTVLNQTPEPFYATEGTSAVPVRVIGWGLWALFFQHHLGHTLMHNFNILTQKQGLPDDARSFSTRMDQTFGGLRLYPFVRRFNCTDVESYHLSVDDCYKLTLQVPHLVPAMCWNYICYEVPFAQQYTPYDSLHVNEWHKHNPPPGTAYNPKPRLNHPSLISRSDAAERLTKLHELAPYDVDISDYIIRDNIEKIQLMSRQCRCTQPCFLIPSLPSGQLRLL
jgi:hypothetical protein